MRIKHEGEIRQMAKGGNYVVVNILANINSRKPN